MPGLFCGILSEVEQNGNTSGVDLERFWVNSLFLTCYPVELCEHRFQPRGPAQGLSSHQAELLYLNVLYYVGQLLKLRESH